MIADARKFTWISPVFWALYTYLHVAIFIGWKIVFTNMLISNRYILKWFLVAEHSKKCQSHVSRVRRLQL